MRAAQATGGRVNLRRKTGYGTAVLAGLALTNALVLRAAREYRPVLIPRRNFYGKRETQQSCRRRASVCASADGDARQRQARPGLAEGELQPYDAEASVTVSHEGYCRTRSARQVVVQGTGEGQPRPASTSVLAKHLSPRTTPRRKWKRRCRKPPRRPQQRAG